MTLSRRPCLAALACAAAALLWPDAPLAQRRVIAPPSAPSTPPPAAEPKREVKAEEKQDEEKKAEAKKEEPKKAASAEAAQDARKPLGVEAPKPEAPAAPVVLVPKDEQEAAKPASKAAAAPKTDEALYRKKIDKLTVTMRVRPARPAPGRTTTLLFEIVKQLTAPDPVLGDRGPLEKANLVATIVREGGKAPTRHTLHAMPDAGIYGLRFTAAEAGQYRIQIDQRLEGAEIGDKALSVDFLLGVGQETSMPVAADEETGVKTGRGRSALKAADGGKDGLPALMRALGEAWVELLLHLENPAATAGIAGTAVAVTEIPSRLTGQAPAGADRREFDTIAAALGSAVRELPAATADAAKLRASMTRAESEACNRCHVKYRFGLTDDLADWPRFAPKTKDAAPRKPAR